MITAAKAAEAAVRRMRMVTAAETAATRRRRRAHFVKQPAEEQQAQTTARAAALAGLALKERIDERTGHKPDDKEREKVFAEAAFAFIGVNSRIGDIRIAGSVYVQSLAAAACQLFARRLIKRHHTGIKPVCSKMIDVIIDHAADDACGHGAVDAGACADKHLAVENGEQHDHAVVTVFIANAPLIDESVA